MTALDLTPVVNANKRFTLVTTPDFIGNITMEGGYCSLHTVGKGRYKHQILIADVEGLLDEEGYKYILSDLSRALCLVQDQDDLVGDNPFMRNVLPMAHSRIVSDWTKRIVKMLPETKCNIVFINTGLKSLTMGMEYLGDKWVVDDSEGFLKLHNATGFAEAVKVQ